MSFLLTHSISTAAAGRLKTVFGLKSFTESSGIGIDHYKTLPPSKDNAPGKLANSLDKGLKSLISLSETHCKFLLPPSKDNAPGKLANSLDKGLKSLISSSETHCKFLLPPKARPPGILVIALDNELKSLTVSEDAPHCKTLPPKDTAPGKVAPTEFDDGLVSIA